MAPDPDGTDGGSRTRWTARQPRGSGGLHRQDGGPGPRPVATAGRGRALALRPGQVACDIGAGPGYFALRLGRELGERGQVWAVDVELRMLEVLRTRIQQAGARNVTPVLSLPADPLLPAGACDLILIVDTYHHFPDGPAYLRRLIRSLKRGG